jgi:hypothetical protein
MDLVELAEDLLSKVRSFVGQSSSTKFELFRLREEIRAHAMGIAHAIDGPEQSIKAIARGVRTMTPLHIVVTETVSSRPAAR